MSGRLGVLPRARQAAVSNEAAGEGALRVRLMLPVLEVVAGPLRLDPLEALLGMPVSRLLEGLRVGQVVRRRAAGGGQVDVYPLAVPDGQGVVMELGSMGSVGVRNERGYLVIRLPLAAGRLVANRLGQGTLAGYQEMAGGRADLWVRLETGTHLTFPLGRFGELGIEAG